MRLLSFAVLLVILGGVSPAVLAELRGRSAADAKLAGDTYRDFVAVAGAHMACSQIEYAEVIESKTLGTVNVDEIWSATGCGKTERFAVSFRPAPQGGYNYTIALKTQSNGSAQPGATSIEVDAAVGRASSAGYLVELASACGWPANERQYKEIKDLAMVLALSKDGLSKKLTTDQFVTVMLRARNEGLVRTTQIRAKEAASKGDCQVAENVRAWESLLRISEVMKSAAAPK